MNNRTTKRQKHLAKQAVRKAIRKLEAALTAIDEDSHNPASEEIHEAREAALKALNHLIVPTSAFARTQ